jgi:hypothetical protein
MVDADEMEGPLDLDFPVPIGGFGRVAGEEPFTGNVNGNKLVPLLWFYLVAVPVVDSAASLGQRSH